MSLPYIYSIKFCSDKGERKSVKKISVFYLAAALLCLFCGSASVYAADNFLEKGIAEFKNENYEEALEFFEKGYKENPIDARITFFLGLTHREMQNYSDAVRFFRQTLILDPEAAEVKFLLADVLFGMGKYKEALDAVEYAIKKGVRSGQSNYLKGMILLKLKKPAEAIQAFNKAKKLEPSLKQQADFQIASAYLQEKKFKKAKEIFKGLLTVDPTSDWALFSKDYLEAIEKIPPPYRIIIGYSRQYDDNVLATPNIQSLVDVPKAEDWKNVYSLLGEYTVFSKGRWNMKASYLLGVTQYGKSDYPKTTAGETIFSQDTVSHTASLMPAYNTEKSITSLLLSFNYLEVDYIKYKQSVTVGPSHTFLIKEGHLGQVFLKYRKDEYDREYNKRKFGSYPSQQEDRDANNVSSGVGYIYTFSKGNGLFNIRVEDDINDADGANWDYMGFKASTGLLYPLINNKLKANIYLEAYRQNYSNTYNVYKKKRRDDNYTVQTSLSYELMKSLDIGVSYTYMDTDSNISVYEYRKNIYSANMELRF